MKKKTKILIFVLVLAAAVLTAGSFGAGNYLVDYALYRTDQAPESAHDGKAPVGETYGNIMDKDTKGRPRNGSC